MALDITAGRRSDGSSRLTLAGEIDISSAKALRDAFGSALRGRGASPVVVDLEHVTFIDSTGIAALVNGRKLAEACGAPFRVVNANDLVQKVFEITGTLAYLNGQAATQ